MVVHNADKSTVLPVKCGDLNVKNVGSVHAVDCDGSAVQIGGSFRNLRLRHTRNDLQLRIRISGHSAYGRRRRDAPQAAGMGHYHAFHIFDDITADLQHQPIRQRTQHLPGFGGGVGNGDWFCTAHSGAQFFFQNRYICVIDII